MKDFLQAEKNTLLEVYRQETENIRFFEDLILKFHFTIFSVVLLVVGYSYSHLEIIGIKDNSIWVTRFIFLVASLFSLLFGMQHVHRMKRLSTVAINLGLSTVYRKYNKVWDKKNHSLSLTYAILLIATFFL